MGQRTWGKCLIHGTEFRKDNQLQSMELPCKYPSRECKHDINESKGNMINPKFKENVQGRTHPGAVYLQNKNYLGQESLKCSSKNNVWP